MRRLAAAATFRLFPSAPPDKTCIPCTLSRTIMFLYTLRPLCLHWRCALTAALGRPTALPNTAGRRHTPRNGITTHTIHLVRFCKPCIYLHLTPHLHCCSKHLSVNTKQHSCQWALRALVLPVAVRATVRLVSLLLACFFRQFCMRWASHVPARVWDVWACAPSAQCRAAAAATPPLAKRLPDAASSLGRHVGRDEVGRACWDALQGRLHGLEGTSSDPGQQLSRLRARRAPSHRPAASSAVQCSAAHLHAAAGAARRCTRRRC